MPRSPRRPALGRPAEPFEPSVRPRTRHAAPHDPVPTEATDPARRRWLKVGAGAGLVAGGLSTTGFMARPARAQDAAVIRLGVIEGFSGPFANAGDAVLRNLRFAAARVNDGARLRLGDRAARFEIVPLDSKGQIDEALNQFTRAADLGLPIVLQGNSSAIAAGLIEAVNRHNARSSGHRMLFLNYSAVDPILTNERCSPWHFRFDADARMRMRALIEALARDPAVTRVHLLNQDYSFGQQVAQLAREMLTERRPDVRIVADELHAMGRIKDFSPYATKVIASGADAVITGNWGNDLTLLVRACREAGADTRFYTFYGNSLGAPQAIGEAGVGRVYAVSEWHPNAGLAEGERIMTTFRQGLADRRDDYFNMRHVVMLAMLGEAVTAAGTTEAPGLATALEGRHYAGPPYAVTMRASDHQLQTPLQVSVMARAVADEARPADTVRHDVEGSGFGFRTVLDLPASFTGYTDSCRMTRPGST